MRSLEAYRDLIVRVERLAEANPLRYRVNLALLAVLGFAYVIAMVLACVLTAGAVLALLVASKTAALIKLALLPLALAFMLVKAMWVRFPPPAGRRVTRREVPALFDEIERVRSALNARPVHEVMLTPEFNAAVTQVPRLGVLGWPRRYLIIGLPLLASLPPYQFRAVLAHEFGHLAANHARFGNWIYRIRQTWYRILEGLERNTSSATRLFTRFFEWYTPYFNAYSFVLARANEYQADRESARVTSPQDAGDALAAVYAKGEYLERNFWKLFYQRANEQPEPPAQPFVEYLTGLRSIPENASESALAAALARGTGLEDTHPSLADRLKALGVEPGAPACFQITAAHALLGAKRAQLTEEFDVAWRESMAGPWKERHAFMQAMKEKLAVYEAAARQRELAEDEQWDYAAALESVLGGKAALPVLDLLLERAPRHAPALYARGRIRLSENDESGASDIERAMMLDDAAREPGAQLLYGYYYSRHDFSRCDRYRSTLQQVQRERQLAVAERAELRSRDVLVPHGLSARELEDWIAVIQREPAVKRAWLVRKQVEHLPNVPAFLLVIQCRLFTRGEQNLHTRLARALSSGHSCLVVRRAGAARKAARVPDALILTR